MRTDDTFPERTVTDPEPDDDDTGLPAAIGAVLALVLAVLIGAAGVLFLASMHYAGRGW